MSCWGYWKVVCRYGHVGRKNEVSVPRYIRTHKDSKLMDVLEIVAGMPGVKKSNNILHGVANAKEIDQKEYEEGKEKEKENLYLQELIHFHKQTVAHSA